MKKTNRSRHEHSLSLDYPSELLNSSRLSNRLSVVDTNKKRSLIYTNSRGGLDSYNQSMQQELPHQTSIKNLLDDLNATSKNSSPHRSQSRHSVLISQPHSGLMTKAHVNQSSEKQNLSLFRAINSAMNIQQEKEKDLVYNKQLLNTELIQHRNDLLTLETKLTTQKKCFNTKQCSIVYQLSELEKRIYPRANVNRPAFMTSSIASTQHISKLSKEDNHELLNKIHRTNDSLRKRLTQLSDTQMSSSTYQSTEHLIPLMSNSQEALRSASESKQELLHKIHEAEDKQRQLREVEGMLEEDYRSNLEQMTEYVAWQEELDNCNDHLRSKNPACYDKLYNEIDNMQTQEVNEARARGIQEELSVKKETQEQRQFELLELLKAYEAEEDQRKYYNDMCQLVLEDIFKREKTLFYLFHRSYHTYRQKYNLKKLFAYLKLFDLNLQALQEEPKSSRAVLLEYHYLMLEEIETVLKHLQDCRNIQGTVAVLEKKSSKESGSRAVLDTLHNELVVKNSLLKEKLISLNQRKEALYEQSSDFENTQQLLKDHKTMSFAKIWSDNREEIEASQCGREMQLTLLTLSQKKRENYQAYFELSSTLAAKQSQLEAQANQIQQRRQDLATVQLKTDELEKELNDISEQDLCLRSQQKHLQEAYSQLSQQEHERKHPNSIPSHSGSFKKVAFQFGDNCLTKIQQSELGDDTQTARANFEKRKAQICEIKTMTKKLKSQCESCSQRLHEIKEQQINTLNMLAEYEVKLVVLSKGLMEILESEKATGQQLESCLHEQKHTEGPLQSIADDLCRSLQMYKVDISKAVCHIIDRVLLMKYKQNGEIPPSHKLDLEHIFRKLEQELEAINESEIHQITTTEDLIADKKQSIKDKEDLVEALDDQLRSLLQFNDLTDSVLPDKASTSIFTICTSSSSKKGRSTSTNIGAHNHSSVLDLRELNGSSFSGTKRVQASLDMEIKSGFPVRRVKPRERNKSFHSNMDFISPLDQHSASESDFNHCGSTDMSSNRSFPRMQSMAHLSQHQSTLNSTMLMNTTLASNSTNIMKSPSVAQTNLTNQSSVFDYSNSNKKVKMTSNPSTAAKRLDVDSYLCSTSKEDVDKATEVMQGGVLLLKKFASNKGLSVNGSNTSVNSARTRRASSAAKSCENGEPEGYGRRVIKINRMNKTLEIYKFKQGSDKTTLEYFFEFRQVTNLFFPAVTGNLLKKIKNQRNKENQKLMTFNGSMWDQGLSQEILLPFGIDVQNRGRVEFLVYDVETLRHVATCISSIIKAKH